MMKTARNISALGLGLGMSTLVGWLLLRRRKTTETLLIRSQVAGEASLPDKIVLPLDPVEDNAPPLAPSAPSASTEPDDLTQINGIGPAFATALNALGITRFAQLADQDADDLAARLAGHVTVTARRIRERDWIGQAARLSGK